MSIPCPLWKWTINSLVKYDKSWNFLLNWFTWSYLMECKLSSAKHTLSSVHLHFKLFVYSSSIPYGSAAEGSSIRLRHDWTCPSEASWMYDDPDWANNLESFPLLFKANGQHKGTLLLLLKIIFASTFTPFTHVRPFAYISLPYLTLTNFPFHPHSLSSFPA